MNPRHGSPEDADPQRARMHSRALPPHKASPGERRVKSLDQRKPFPVNNEVVQMCCLRAPAAAAHEGRRDWLPPSSTAQDCLPAPLSGQHLQAPSDTSLSWCRHGIATPGYRQECLPGTSTPGCIGVSHHLLGLLRLMSHRGEHGLGGVRPRPDETRVEPQFQMQTGAPRGKTWQAGCISSGVRNPEKQQVASGALFLSVS